MNFALANIDGEAKYGLVTPSPRTIRRGNTMTSKDRVLEFLEKNRENYISGEAMADSLGLSRNAIWKAINELRKKGYDIQAASNKGYKLGDSNDIVSAQGILASLDGAGFEPSLGMIHIYDTVDSTNKVAKEMAIAGAEHGTLVVARAQDGGRGRRDHSFFSPEGGIYMSLILSPDKLKSLEPDVITTTTGNAVKKALKTLCNLDATIKPINDLFINNKKICGILTESGTEFDSGLVQWIVVGIGINFDSDISKFPPDLRETAASLYAPGQATITKNQLIAAIYQGILTS